MPGRSNGGAGWRDRIKRWVPYVVLVMVTGAAAIAIVQPFGDDADTASLTWSTRVALLLVLVPAAVWLVVDPGFLRRYVKSVKLPGGVELALQDYEREAVEDPADEGVGGEAEVATVGLAGSGEGSRWSAAQLKIEAKIGYMAKHTIPDHLEMVDPSGFGHGAARPFANIGTLAVDDYLNTVEASLGNLVLRTSAQELALLTDESRAELVRDAEDLARTIRARVFRRLVLKFLRHHASTVGAAVERHDRIVVSHDRCSVEVWPTFGPVNGDLVGRRAAALNREGGGVIVKPIYPAGGRNQLRRHDKDVVVVTMDRLLEAIQERLDARPG